jgi:hypothetical protein
MVNQNLPHRLCRASKEVRTVVAINRRIPHYLEVSFVHYSGGLKGMVGPLTTHVATCQSSQLVINEGYELGGCPLVSLGHFCEENSYIAECALHLRHSFPTGTS